MDVRGRGKPLERRPARRRPCRGRDSHGVDVGIAQCDWLGFEKGKFKLVPTHWDGVAELLAISKRMLVTSLEDSHALLRTIERDAK